MEQFLKACGAGETLELTAADAAGQAAGRLTVPQPFALVGRDPSNDLYLDDPQVSQRHAYLQVIDGQVFCVDLGSRTGIRCGGNPGTSGWLVPRQGLQVGPYILQLADAQPGERGPTAPSGNPLEARAADQHQLPPVTLEFANGLTRQPRWRLNRVLTLVGRAPGCKLQLADVTVSRFHCALLALPQGVWMIDLLGKEGTRVNGERVRWAQLEDGDRLHVGKFLIRLWHEIPTGTLSAAVVVSSPGSGTGPRPPGVAPPEASPLAPLLQHFQRLQQQASDDFHETMLAVLQMFAAVQRERVEPLREDLDHVYQLTLELQHLQAEQTQQVSGEAKPADGTAKTPLHEGLAVGDVPAWLNQRIAALQQERQGHWHKVLDAVLGRGA
jgi:pSer/pThr/pTyr-binding forkhead associated (FHA) protein